MINFKVKAMIKKILFILSIFAILLGCSPQLNIPEVQQQRIKNLIISLEENPNIDNSRFDETRELLKWALTEKYFIWILELPEPYDSSYNEVSLINGYIFGVLYYVLENWREFKGDHRSNRDFNIEAYMRGIEGMVKWYKGAVRVKGINAKNPVMEDLIAQIEAGKLREISEKYIDNIIKNKRGYDVIIVFIR